MRDLKAKALGIVTHVFARLKILWYYPKNRKGE
jgi:hypothetical protein